MVSQVHESKSSSSSRDIVLAAARRVLTVIAAWTNLLFDGAAGRRLIDVPVPPDGVFFGPDLARYLSPRSAGGRVEDSIVMLNLERASDFTASGEWPGTVEELVGVVKALEPFRVVLEREAICGPYTDSRIEEKDRQLLLGVLNQLLARRILLVGQPLTLPQVAILAGLSEKSVRMAATGRDRNPDLVSYKEGSMALVAAEEAERWLTLRRSYKPTRVRGDIAALSTVVRTNHQIAVLLSALRERAKLTIPELGKLMGWSPRQLATYARVEEAWWTPEEIVASVFDVQIVARLARVLKVCAPLEFVRAVSRFFLEYQVDQIGAEYLGSPDGQPQS